MNNNKISVAKIVSSTSVDGVGLRNALYVAGCHLRCEGCHNSHLWDIQSGTWMSIDEVYEELNRDEFNISILGGEPLLQPAAIIELCRRIKANTDKTIWLWTGYKIETVSCFFPELLDFVDVIVDGPFIKELADPTLEWRGSSNQRVININTYLKK